TPWTCGSFSASSNRGVKASSSFSAKAPAAGSGSTVLTTLSFELPLMSGTMVLPHQPSPHTATPSFSTSVHRGVRFAHHARPAPRLRRDEFGERRRRRAGRHLGAAVLEPFGHLGGPHRGLDCGKKPFHYVSRSAGRHEHALPRSGDEVGIAGLDHGRRRGRLLHAPLA